MPTRLNVEQNLLISKTFDKAAVNAIVDVQMRRKHLNYHHHLQHHLKIKNKL
jgi:hypothetical protein